MTNIDIGLSAVFPGKGGAEAPVIYVIDAAEHPFDVAGIAQNLTCSVAKVCVRDWNSSLTPWPAPALYRGEPDFAGKAADTLAELVGETIPQIEQASGLAPAKRAVCGYSLGGLFALYAFAHEQSFSACACLSGSVWYPGWVDHLRELDVDYAGRFAFLSIGSKEKHAAPKPLHHVQYDMQACAAILRERGCAAELVIGHGGHMSFVKERFDAGIGALDAFLA